MMRKNFSVILLWCSLIAPAVAQSVEAHLKIAGRDFFGQGITLHKLSRDDSGTWPLTIDEVWLGCRSDLKIFTVIMYTGQDAWALNGATRGHARRGNYMLTIDGVEHVVQTDLDAQWWWAYEDSEVELEKWRLLNPDAKPKKNISPIFDFVNSLGCLDL